MPETCDYDFSEIDSMHRQWLKLKNARQNTSPGAFDAFLERLTRSWAIETGIIEGLYTLERGMTETLVMRGISANLIEHDSTNKDPHELAAILDDHQNAVFGVYSEIKEGKPITRSAIRQLHSILTENQPTYSAVDQFGRQFDVPLEHGGFKKLPNNPTRPDGALHEYCPPEHVDSELDNLLAWYDLYVGDTQRYHPLATAAWFHHRFTQIHPFQDGNGRVIRALLTWHLVREDYLPSVVTRDHRAEYIYALERGDNGDLGQLVNLLVRLQKETILDSLSAFHSGQELTRVGEAVEYLVGRVLVANVNRDAETLSANQVVESLRDHLAGWLDNQSEHIALHMREIGVGIQGAVERGGPGSHENRYTSEIAQVAQDSRYPFNPNESSFFAELSLRPDQPTRFPHLIFVVSLHHAGHQFTGILAGNVFGRVEHYRYDPERPLDDEPERSFTEHWFNTGEPFVFTLHDDARSLFERAERWTERHLAEALHRWGERFA